MKSVFGACGAAMVFWFFLFSPWTAQIFNFWATLTAAAFFLAGIFLFGQRGRYAELLTFRFSDIIVGLISAALLYGIFYAGFYLISDVLTFGRGQVSRIYEIRAGADPRIVGALLFFIIGPAEALFWQGFVQQRLGRRYGVKAAYVITVLIYSAVHLWACNVSLLLAAMVCGLFWGYMFLRSKRLWPVIISHAAWDVVIFVIRPIQ
jgi:uncharacterized protein